MSLDKQRVIKRIVNDIVPILTYTSETCSICYENPCSIGLDNCLHRFCRDCIRNPLNQSKICPMCNTAFSVIIENEDYASRMAAIVQGNKGDVVKEIQETKFFTKDACACCLVLASMYSLPDYIYQIVSPAMETVDGNTFVSRAKKAGFRNSLLSETECINLVIPQGMVIRKEGRCIYIGTFDDTLTGKGTAYYPSMMTIEGSFVNGYPSGQCSVLFSRSDCTETVGFREGKRMGPSVLAWKSGLQVTGKVNDVTTKLLSPIIPFTRNYYNHSLFDFGHPMYTLEEASLDEESVLTPDLAWWLVNCDLQQPSLTIDLSRTGMTEITSHLQAAVNGISFTQSSRFNRVGRVTLACHQLIKQTHLNYMLPELTRFRNINLSLLSTIERAEQVSLTADALAAYDTVLLALLEVLNHSEQLSKVEIIAFPRPELSLQSGLWQRITELVIHSCYRLTSLTFPREACRLQSLTLQECSFQSLTFGSEFPLLTNLLIERCMHLQSLDFLSASLPSCVSLTVARCTALEKLHIGDRSLPKATTLTLEELPMLQDFLADNEVCTSVSWLRLSLPQLKTIVVGANSFTAVKELSLVSLQSLQRFSTADGSFDNATLVILYPLLQCISFEVGADGFPHTTLLILEKMPQLRRFRCGDRSFRNTRLVPLCGKLGTLAPSAEETAEEKAIQLMQNPFTELTEVEIGENCFFNTVVLFCYNLPKLAVLRIGKESMSDMVTIAFTDLPELKEFVVESAEMRKLTSVRFDNVPQLQYISFHRRNGNAKERQPVSPFEFPVLTNFLYCKPISESMLRQANMPRVIENKHPNDWYRDSDYKGHVVHEVPDMKKDIERLKRELENRDS